MSGKLPTGRATCVSSTCLKRWRRTKRAVRPAFFWAMVVLIFPPGCKPHRTQGGREAEREKGTPVSSRTNPIRWTDHVGLEDIDLIRTSDVAFRQPVDLGGNDQGPTFVDDARDRRSPQTCEDYFTLLDQGYAPGTTVDITLTSFFIERCETLMHLREARPAQVSYLNGLRFDQGALSTLPASLMPRLVDEQASAARSASQTWLEVDPDAKIVSAEPLRLIVESNGFRVTLEILAWADFDHDGIEDVLLMVSNYVLEGTLRFYHHAGLTRHSVAGLVLGIDLSE